MTSIFQGLVEKTEGLVHFDVGVGDVASSFATLPGVAGSYFSTPDSVDNSIRQSIIIEADIAPDDWTPAAQMGLVSKYIASGNQRSWSFNLTVSGLLNMTSTEDGTSTVITSSLSSVATGFADGTRHTVKVEWNPVTGIASYFADGLPLGVPQAHDAQSIFDGTAEIAIGALSEGAASIYTGKFYSARVYKGVTPEPYAVFDGEDGSYLSTPDTVENSIRGNIVLEADIAADDWTPVADSAIIGKYGVAGARSYLLTLIPSGQIRLSLSADGTNVFNNTSNTPVFVDGSRHTVKVEADFVTGKSMFYFDGVLTGTGNLNAALTSIFDSTAAVAVGSRDGGAVNLFDGIIYDAKVYKGIPDNPVDAYVVLDGASGTYVSTPDSPANSVTGSITIEADIASDDYDLQLQAVVSKWTVSGNQRSYNLRLTTNNQMQLLISANGTDIIVALSAAMGFAAGSRHTIKAEFDVTTQLVTFYTDGVQLGTPVALALSAIHDSTGPLDVGSRTLGTAERFIGIIYDAKVYDGITAPNSVSDVAVNGNFATLDGWDAAGSWALNIGFAKGGPFGTGSLLTNDGEVVNGQTYTVTWTMTNFSGSGGFQVALGGVTGAAQLVDGTFVEVITAGGTAITFENLGGALGEVSNVSVVGGDAGPPTVGTLVLDMDPYPYIQGDTVFSSPFVEFGPNFLINGGFADGTGWSLGSGWTIADGKATGVNGADLLSDTPVVDGDSYILTLTISGYVSGDVNWISGSQTGIDYDANGTYEEQVFAGGTLFALRGNSLFNGSIDNVTLRDTNGAVVFTLQGAAVAVSPIDDGLKVHMDAQPALQGGATFPLDASSQAVAILPGDANDLFSTPDTVANSIAGTMDIRWLGSIDEWIGGTTVILINKGVIAPEVSWWFDVTTTGFVRFIWTSNGTTLIVGSSTVAVAFADGSVHGLRVIAEPNRGGSRYFTFYTSDDGVVWTQLGDVVTAGATTFFDSTSSIDIGTVSPGNAPTGTCLSAQVLDGIDGPVVADFDPATLVGWTLEGNVSVTGVWTINGNAIATSPIDDGLKSSFNPAVIPNSTVGGEVWTSNGDVTLLVSAMMRHLYWNPISAFEAAVYASVGEVEASVGAGGLSFDAGSRLRIAYGGSDDKVLLPGGMTTDPTGALIVGGPPDVIHQGVGLTNECYVSDAQLAGLLSESIAWFDETSIEDTSPGSGFIRVWHNKGTGGTGFDLGTIVGTAGNLTRMANGESRLPGETGDFFSTPNSALNSPSGDIDIRWHGSFDDWTPVKLGVLVSKFGAGQDWVVRCGNGGNLALFNGNIAVSSTEIVPAPDGGEIHIRVTRTVFDGETLFYTSSDGVNWVQLGNPLILSAGIATPTDAQQVIIGSIEAAGQEQVGYCVSCQVYDGIYNGGPLNEPVGGELVLNGDFATGDTTDWTTANSTPVVVDGLLTLTLTADNGRVQQSIPTVQGRRYRLRGFVEGGTAQGKLLIGTSGGSGNVHNTTVNAGVSANVDVTFIAGTASVVNLQGSVNGTTCMFANISVVELTPQLAVNFDPSQATEPQTAWVTAIGEELWTDTPDGVGTGWTDNLNGTYTKVAGVSGTLLNERSTVENGLTYECTYTLSGYSGTGDFRFRIGTASAQDVAVNGTYTDTIVASGVSAGAGIDILAVNSGMGGTFSNISVKELEQVWTPQGDAFVNTTGKDVVNAAGGVGIKSAVGQAIATPLTYLAAAKVTTLTGITQFYVTAHTITTQSPQTFVNTNNDYSVNAGITASVSPANTDPRVLTVEQNADVTSKFTVSDVGNIVGDIGTEPFDFGSLFQAPDGTSTIVAWIGEVVVFDRALTAEEVSIMQDYLANKWT